MQSSDLINFIQLFPSIVPNFVGVYSITNIPKKISNEHFLIVNTDPESLPGKHWFCLIKRKRFFEYFDSLGVDNKKLLLVKDNLSFQKTLVLKYNSTCVQQLTSDTCGQFVLYFLINRYHNLDLSYYELLNEIFTDDLSTNERKVTSFVSMHHG